jgi:transcriptional regulator
MDKSTIYDYNSPLVYALEEILFKGKTHSKRGSGLTTIPEKVLKFDVCEGINVKKEIKELFIYHFRESLRRDNETRPIEEKIEISSA